MTELLERAVEAARGLDPATQDEIARLVLQLAGDDEPQIASSDDERAVIARSKAAAARGEFATDEQAPAVWAEHGLIATLTRHAEPGQPGLDTSTAAGVRPKNGVSPCAGSAWPYNTTRPIATGS